MAQLATFDDYYTVRGLTVPAAPTDAERDAVNEALSAASRRVKRALRLARYSAAADGLPRRTAQRQAIVEAVVVQAAQEHADADAGSGGVEYVSASMAGVTLTAAAGSSSGPVRDARTGMIREAVDVLVSAGFYSTAVRS